MTIVQNIIQDSDLLNFRQTRSYRIDISHVKSKKKIVVYVAYTQIVVGLCGGFDLSFRKNIVCAFSLCSHFFFTGRLRITHV